METEKQLCTSCCWARIFGHNHFLDKIQSALGITGVDRIVTMGYRAGRLLGKANRLMNQHTPITLMGAFTEHTIDLNTYEVAAKPRIFERAADIEGKQRTVHQAFHGNTEELLEDIGRHRLLLKLMPRVDPYFHVRVSKLNCCDWNVQRSHRSGSIEIFFKDEAQISKNTHYAKEKIIDFHRKQGNLNKGPSDVGFIKDGKNVCGWRMDLDDFARLTALVGELQYYKSPHDMPATEVETILKNAALNKPYNVQVR
ncbi:MAG: hypothetical protein H6908_04975 [Hyphomicrobiales bacterium]|nr:hypothetical protein [Hyphomicrobiales bacterium]